MRYTHQDSWEVGERLTDHEEIKCRGRTGQSVGQFCRRLPPFPHHTPCVIRAQGDEDGQGDDLEGQTGNHDVDALLRFGVGVGSVGQCSADGLQHEGKDVAADEDVGVGVGREAGLIGAVDGDDARQADVDAGGQEAGGDGQGDDVEQERIRLERVVVHLDAGDVAEDLEDLAADDAGEEGPGAVANAEGDLDDEDYGEDGEEDDVAGQGGDIVDGGKVEGAGADFAVLDESVIVGDDGDVGGRGVGNHLEVRKFEKLGRGRMRARSVCS